MARTRLPTDTRGVSEVIGSILVFGLVIALISLLQVQAVPNANEEVEFEHSNAVTNDMANLRVAISEAVETGRTREANVRLGVDYPARLLFYNPPPANGRMRTTSEANITLRHVTSPDSAGKLFDATGAAHYRTRALAYSVDYNELETTTERVREPTVYYEAHENATLVKETTFIDDREITVVAIGGNLSATGVAAETLAARPLSGPAETYTVRNASGGPINVTVPTKLSKATWNETLADEYAAGASAFGTTVAGGDGYVQKVTYNETDGEFNELHVELEPNEDYTLRMAKIGFGTGGDPTPTYVVSAPDDDSQTASVEVRDRYNNPVSGVTLWANTSSGTLSNGTTTGTNLTVTTGPDGTASIERVGSTAATVEFSDDLDGNGTVTSLETQQASFAGMDGPILLTDVSDAGGSDTITLIVANEGTDREITRVQTHYVTQVESREMVENANLVNSVAALVNQDLNRVNNTNVTDGPNAVTDIGGTALASNAVEGEAATGFTGSGPTVPTGSSSLTLTFDQDYVLVDRGALLVEVTVFYEGGHRERYTVHLFDNET